MALATLFHVEPAALLRPDGGLPGKVTTAAVVISALLVLWRAGEPRWLLLLAVTQVADVLVALPHVPNHWLLCGLANVGLLAFALRAALRDRALPVDGEALLRAAAPSLRVGTALFYAFTCLWKLNRDFVRPEVSCAAAGWASVAGLYGLPDGAPFAIAVIAGTLLVEGAIPFLLLVPATRAYAALGMAVFHLLLGLDAVHRYLNFSSVMFALLFVSAWPENLPSPRASVRTWTWVARVWAVFWAAMLGAVVFPADLGSALVAHGVARQCAFLVHAAAVVALLALAAREARPRVETPVRMRVLGWVFPALVLVNGCGPVLGIRNRGSWQMYSNLRLEAETSNHLFVPRSLDLLGLLHDRVEVLATSDAELATAYVSASLALPWVSFREELARHPGASVRYRRAGREHSVHRVADDPVLATPPPWPARALFFLRPLGPAVARQCVW
jgi:hypothetical protein